MRIKLELPRENPKVSIEAEVNAQQVMNGLVQLYHAIKSKLPFKIEVEQNANTHQD